MKNKDFITLDAYFVLYLITVQENGLVELRFIKRIGHSKGDKYYLINLNKVLPPLPFSIDIWVF